MHQMHEVEGGLKLISAPPLIVPVARLYTITPSIQDRLRSSQIYFVMRRPRMSLVPDSVYWDGRVVRARIKAQIKDRFEEFEICGPLPFSTQFVPTRIWAGEEYPSSTLFISFLNNGEEGIVELSLTDFMMKKDIERPELEYFHIDYIGHALGRTGLKGAMERLVGRSGKRSAHEHLQEILVELNSRHPDHEAFVALFSFAEQRRLVSGGATAHTPIHSFSFDRGRLDPFLDTPIPRDARIKLAEAALINHFKPRFNDRYKVWFPSSKHRVLDLVRQIDFTAISVEFDTMWLGAEFYTEAAPPSRSHAFSISIATDAERVSILDL